MTNANTANELVLNTILNVYALHIENNDNLLSYLKNNINVHLSVKSHIMDDVEISVTTLGLLKISCRNIDLKFQNKSSDIIVNLSIYGKNEGYIIVRDNKPEFNSDIMSDDLRIISFWFLNRS